MSEVEEWLKTARLAADAAAAVHAAHLGHSHHASTEAKGRSDFVSAVDLLAQETIVDLISRRHPAHVILGEEEGLGHDRLQSREPLWIVDPLDGTTNFLHGHPAFASSVAIAVEGVVQCGAVTAAATEERWWASAGGGSWFRGPGDDAPRPNRVSRTATLDEALVGTGFPFKALEMLPGYLSEFDAVLRRTSGVRRAGAAALDLCFLASGRLDAFWERHLAPWDIAAGLIVLAEAGGVYARPDGSPLDLRAGAVVAANSEVFLDELRTVLDGATAPTPRT